MTRRSYSGNAKATTLSGDISAAATSINVADGAGYPTGSAGPFVITIDGGLAAEEKVLCSGRTGNTITATTRGWDGTTAADHDNQAPVQHTISATDLDEANAHVNSTAAAHAATAISYAGSTNLVATNVEAALDELDTEKSGTGHSHTAQTASTVAFTPAGNIAATDVQAALVELDSEKSGTAHTHAAAAVTMLTVRKTATESVTSSTALQNDDHLLFPVAAGETWAFEMTLFVDNASSSTPDIKVAVTVPAGATVRYGLIAMGTGAGNPSDVTSVTVESSATSGTAITAGTPDASAFSVVGTMVVRGSVLNAATAGNVTLQWAQNVSNAAATRVYAGSYLVATKVA